MAEQHLDLLQLAASGLAKFRRRSPQVMRRDSSNADSDGIKNEATAR
jgi:hypothetical protein